MKNKLQIRGLWAMVVVTAFCCILIQQAPSYALSTAKQSVAGKRIPGVIGTTNVKYGHRYYAEDPLPEGQYDHGWFFFYTTLASINSYTPPCNTYYFPSPSKNGWAESDWSFTAVQHGDGKTVIIGDSLEPTPYKYALQAKIQTPKPDYGLALGKNWTKLTIGKTQVGYIDQTSAFAETFWPMSNPFCKLLAKIRAGAIIDDNVTFSEVWTMGAQGHADIDIYQFDVTLMADGGGSWAEIDDTGITLGNICSTIEGDIYAMNHLSFSGEASLDDGVFNAVGDFATLSWDLTYDPGSPTYVVSAFLDSGQLPDTITFLASDVGNEQFWNSNPWFQMETQLFAGEAVPAPAAILLGNIGVGLVGCLIRRRML